MKSIRTPTGDIFALPSNAYRDVPHLNPVTLASVLVSTNPTFESELFSKANLISVYRSLSQQYFNETETKDLVGKKFKEAIQESEEPVVDVFGPLYSRGKEDLEANRRRAARASRMLLVALPAGARSDNGVLLSHLHISQTHRLSNTAPGANIGIGSKPTIALEFPDHATKVLAKLALENVTWRLGEFPWCDFVMQDYPEQQDTAEAMETPDGFFANLVISIDQTFLLNQDDQDRGNVICTPRYMHSSTNGPLAQNFYTINTIEDAEAFYANHKTWIMENFSNAHTEDKVAEFRQVEIYESKPMETLVDVLAGRFTRWLHGEEEAQANADYGSQ
ncbi:MAG: hypothetical protein Q9208_001911 [Pyrenodesmia sp. 3 TL-2023]